MRLSVTIKLTTILTGLCLAVSASAETVDLDGTYFYGSLMSDASSSHEPYSEFGDQTISGSNVNLNFASSDNPSNVHTVTLSDVGYDNDGWLIMQVDNGEYIMPFTGAMTDSAIAFLTRTANVYNEVGMMVSLKKSTSVSAATLAGDYSIYGHYIGVGLMEQWSSSTSGSVHIDSTGSINWNVSSDFETPDTGTTTYTYDATESTITVDGVGMFGVGQGGLMMRFQTEITSDDELSYEILVKRSSDKTMADFVGCWLFQTFVTSDDFRMPYTGWGRAVVFDDGTFLVDKTINGPDDPTDSGTFSVQPTGEFSIITDLNLTYTGTINETSDIAVMQMAQPDFFHGVGIAMKMQLDPAADSDNDGVINSEEFVNKIDPLNPDTDGDFMPDGWELSNSLNPRDNDSGCDDDADGLTCLQEYLSMASPLLADTDNDGLNDGQEITAGTDPADASSTFSVVYLDTQTASLTWHGSSSATYTVYWKDNLSDVWVAAVAPALTYDTDTVTWIDTGDATSVPPRPAPSQAAARYYKIVAQ